MKGKVTAMKRGVFAIILGVVIAAAPLMSSALERFPDRGAGETENTEVCRDDAGNGDTGTGVMETRMHEMFAQRPPIPEYIVEEAKKNDDTPGSSHSFKGRLMIMYRLVEHLGLDEKTATKFFPVYLSYINNRNKLYSEHRELTREIWKRAEDESVPVNELRKEVDRLAVYEEKVEQERKDFFKKAEGILNERQYVKLMIFNDKLKEDLILKIREERMRRGRGRPGEDARDGERPDEQRSNR